LQQTTFSSLNAPSAAMKKMVKTYFSISSNVFAVQVKQALKNYCSCGFMFVFHSINCHKLYFLGAFSLYLSK